MKPQIKIKFTDFWKSFDTKDNYFTKLLSLKYDVEISDNPDILIFSCEGFEHRKYNCIKVFYTGEFEQPNFNMSNYALTFDFMEHPKQYRLPLYALYSKDIYNLTKEKNIEQILFEKKKFCNFIYSNDMSSHRKNFFHKLSKYKKVDSGGRVLNNIGHRVGDKHQFMNEYKFSISFENASYPGYTTEKIADPMFVNSIPIYWGNPLVDRDFNTKSFINWHDYGSDEAVIEKIIEIDNDDDLYVKMLKEPFFTNNEMPDCVKKENVLAFFDMIIENKKEIPIAKTVNGFMYKNFILNPKCFMHNNMSGLWAFLYKVKNSGKYGK